MKVATVWQPWASLIAHEFKIFETRGWRTHHRGPLAIHAAKRVDQDVVTMIQQKYPHIWREISPLPMGAIVAVAELVDCWKSLDGKLIEAQPPGEKRVRLIETQELIFGDYTPGRFAWELANVRRLPKPIPAKGKQGLWNWDEVCADCELP